MILGSQSITINMFLRDRWATTRTYSSTLSMTLWLREVNWICSDLLRPTRCWMVNLPVPRALTSSTVRNPAAYSSSAFARPTPQMDSNALRDLSCFERRENGIASTTQDTKQAQGQWGGRQRRYYMKAKSVSRSKREVDERSQPPRDRCTHGLCKTRGRKQARLQAYSTKRTDDHASTTKQKRWEHKNCCSAC